MPLNYTAFFSGWQGFFPDFLCYFGNYSEDKDSFPPFSGKDTVYFLEIIRYNQENDIVCPAESFSCRGGALPLPVILEQNHITEGDKQ